MALAQFVEEMMAEEKYCGDYSSRLPDRLAQLNASQLARMQEALEDAARAADTKLLRNANRSLLVQVAPQADFAMEQKIRKDKVELDARKKQQKKADQQVAMIAGAERMRQIIIERAHKQAQQEIEDRERARIVHQKAETLKMMPVVEKQRTRYFILSGVLLVVLVAGIVLTLTNLAVILIGVGIACIISALIAWRGHSLTKLGPKIVPQDKLDHEIEERTRTLIEEKLQQLKQREAEAKARERAQREEQREARRQRQLLQAAGAELPLESVPL